MKNTIIIIPALLIALLLCGSASAGNFTTDDEVWYNTDNSDGEPTLYAYNTTNDTTRNVTTLDKVYGDVAWAPDGNLYGVTWSSNPTIDRINTTTGASTVVTTLTGTYYNAMASDDLGWLYIARPATSGSTGFQRYNIYSGVLEPWIDPADYGVSGYSGGDCAFVNDDFYALRTNGNSWFLIKIAGLDANHTATPTTTVTTIINNLPPNAYVLARGSNNDLYFTASDDGYMIGRINLADNTVNWVEPAYWVPYGASSKIFAENEPVNPINPVNPTEPSEVNAASEEGTIGMQETGLPIAGLILAILMLFSGLITSKR